MFNIQVSNSDLIYATDCLSGTVGNNSQNLGDDGICITDLGNNSLELYTTNSIEFSKIVIILSSGSTSVEKMPQVNFKRFKQIIDSISPDEYITIKGNTNGIEISYGGKKPIKLSGTSNVMTQYPVAQNNVSSCSIDISPSVFKKIIFNACNIIKEDSNNLISNCVKIEANGFDLSAIAIDNKSNRIFSYTGTTLEHNNGSILLECHKVKKNIKLFNFFDSVILNDFGNLISITGSNFQSSAALKFVVSAEYCSRTLSGQYPTIDPVKMIGTVNEFIKISKPDFLACIDRANAIEDNTIGTGTFDLSIKDDKVTVSKTSQYGTLEDTFSSVNTANTPIVDVFKSKAICDIINTYATTNFEIGKINQSNVNGNLYAIKAPDSISSDDSSFIISAYGNATP